MGLTAICSIYSGMDRYETFVFNAFALMSLSSEILIHDVSLCRANFALSVVFLPPLAAHFALCCGFVSTSCVSFSLGCATNAPACATLALGAASSALG